MEMTIIWEKYTYLFKKTNLYSSSSAPTFGHQVNQVNLDRRGDQAEPAKKQTQLGLETGPQWTSKGPKRAPEQN